MDPATASRTSGCSAATPRGSWPWPTPGPNTNGSQFFIVHGEDAGLPPTYTIFGRVSDGLDVVDKIAATPVSARGGERSKPDARRAHRVGPGHGRIGDGSGEARCTPVLHPRRRRRDRWPRRPARYQRGQRAHRPDPPHPTAARRPQGPAILRVPRVQDLRRPQRPAAAEGQDVPGRDHDQQGPHRGDACSPKRRRSPCRALSSWRSTAISTA